MSLVEEVWSDSEKGNAMFKTTLSITLMATFAFVIGADNIAQANSRIEGTATEQAAPDVDCDDGGLQLSFVSDDELVREAQRRGLVHAALGVDELIELSILMDEEAERAGKGVTCKNKFTCFFVRIFCPNAYEQTDGPQGTTGKCHPKV